MEGNLKKGREDRIVCWCAGITAKEIIDAVKRGATTIEEVRQITGKKRSGFCETENPRGTSCEYEFELIIKEAILQEKLRQMRRFPFG